MQGHYRDALEVGLHSLALRERVGRQEDIALELNNIGIVYESQGNEELALEYYRRALALEEQLGADTTAALSSIAHVYRLAGRLDEALASFRDVRARFEARGNRARSPRLLVAANPVSDRPALPDAERQGHDLAVLYGASRTRLLVGSAATEPRVRAAAADATVLHFATHGVLDDANPMYSFLQLTRSGATDADGDGRVEAWEIQALKFDASVAVLTACDTGRGRLADGEGLIGLAWAFFAAGTPATVVSLWPLESASATTLTLSFHRRLRASLVAGHAEVADSLRAAALELRRAPRYRHPFYWAGLVSVGDGY